MVKHRRRRRRRRVQRKERKKALGMEEETRRRKHQWRIRQVGRDGIVHKTSSPGASD